jgi:hypothetical protein
MATPAVVRSAAARPIGVRGDAAAVARSTEAAETLANPRLRDLLWLIVNRIGRRQRRRTVLKAFRETWPNTSTGCSRQSVAARASATRLFATEIGVAKSPR